MQDTVAHCCCRILTSRRALRACAADDPRILMPSEELRATRQDLEREHDNEEIEVAPGLTMLKVGSWSRARASASAAGSAACCAVYSSTYDSLTSARNEADSGRGSAERKGAARVGGQKPRTRQGRSSPTRTLHLPLSCSPRSLQGRVSGSEAASLLKNQQVSSSDLVPEVYEGQCVTSVSCA